MAGRFVGVRPEDAAIDDLPGNAHLASTEPGPGMLGIRRLDAAHLAVNIPHTATEGMDEGEIVLTIELLHRATGAIIKAEKRTIPIVKVRNFNPE